LVSYFLLTVLAFGTPTLGISNGHPWSEYGNFLEPHATKEEALAIS